MNDILAIILLISIFPGVYILLYFIQKNDDKRIEEDNKRYRTDYFYRKEKLRKYYLEHPGYCEDNEYTR